MSSLFTNEEGNRKPNRQELDTVFEILGIHFTNETKEIISRCISFKTSEISNEELNLLKLFSRLILESFGMLASEPNPYTVEEVYLLNKIVGRIEYICVVQGNMQAKREGES